MADLTTTITENVTLNGAVRGTTNTITTTGIVDVFERILTCAHSNTTTIATFASTPHGAANALDVENTKYIRVTNLSPTEDLRVAFVGTASLYEIVLRPGTSHILFQAEEILEGEEDTTPGFPTLEDLVTIQVRPHATTDAQVEIFVALV